MIPKRINDYDWEQAFGYAPFGREDVESVIYAVDGVNDGDSWVGVFRLHDGRVGYLSAGCDYTGWDCRSGGHGDTRAALVDVLRELCEEDDRKRFEQQEKLCFRHEDCWASKPLAQSCYLKTHGE